MLKTRYLLCELCGIPLYIDASFIFLLLAFTFSTHSLVYGITMALVLAISVVLHELGHSLTARAFGYHTQDITISLLGGCASLISLPRKGYQEFLTALAGPLVSFALAFTARLTLNCIPPTNHYLIITLYNAYYLNLMLGGFNLLPGFPLDGGRIFRSLLLVFLSRPKATYVAMLVGRAFAIILGLNGLHAVIYGGGWGFVKIFIAWMIWKEGFREYLLAKSEGAWDNFRAYRARVSPPPYGGKGGDCDLNRN